MWPGLSKYSGCSCSHPDCFPETTEIHRSITIYNLGSNSKDIKSQGHIFGTHHVEAEITSHDCYCSYTPFSVHIFPLSLSTGTD